MDPHDQPQKEEAQPPQGSVPSTALVPLAQGAPASAPAPAPPAANPGFIVQILASNQHLGDFRRYRRIDPRQAGMSYGARAKAPPPRLKLSRQA